MEVIFFPFNFLFSTAQALGMTVVALIFVSLGIYWARWCARFAKDTNTQAWPDAGEFDSILVRLPWIRMTLSAALVLYVVAALSYAGPRVVLAPTEVTSVNTDYLNELRPADIEPVDPTSPSFDEMKKRIGDFDKAQRLRIKGQGYEDKKQ